MSNHAPLRKDQEQLHRDADQEQFDHEAPARVQDCEDEIARLAYQYWLDRGAPIGTPDDDWLRAEEVIRSLRLS